LAGRRALLAAAALAWAFGAQAQEAWPARPVELVVPYAAGGGVDAMARIFALEAARETGQPWTVVNREGGGGVVGFTALSRARPTGETVVFSPASPLTNSPFVNTKMPFQANQIQPVCQVFENVFSIAVRQDSPIRSMADLMARAKAQPGSVSYGHAGPASVPHLSLAAIEKASGVKFNAIAYRGDGAMWADLLGGTLDFGAPALSSIAGKPVRVLAVLSDQPHPAYPDAPTVAQLGYKAISPGLNGLFVPAGTPPAVLQKMEALCRKVVASTAFVQSAKDLQQVPRFLAAMPFQARIDATYKIHAELVPDLKLERN